LASIINASNSGFGGIVSTGDSSGQLALQAAGTTVATIQSTGLNLGSNGVVFSDSSTQTAAASPYVLKNRIINGDMRIDQRNAGASITQNNSGTQYSLDRWLIYGSPSSKFTIQQDAGAVTPPVGFNDYLGCTSTSAYTVGTTDEFNVIQRIEGYNIADLAWGTASAKTVTLSFWVRSSLTGTFGGILGNNTLGRNYVFSYTISAANTWEQKTITITGDTSGTWLNSNGTGIQLYFSIGCGSTYQGTAGSWGSTFRLAPTGQTSVVGTNGATFYITGVQLEQNTSATPFERRLYGQELINCQRYFAKMGTAGTLYSAFGSCGWTASTSASGFIKYPTTMRSSPTLAYGGVIGFSYAGGSVSNVTGVGSTYAGTDSVLWQPSGLTGATNGQAGIILANNDSTAFISFSAEL
jgi:hypothetical protein